MRLGRCPHDPARLAAAPDLHRYGLTAPRPSLDRSGIAFQPGLYDNDQLPDCTVAGLANAATASALALGAAPPMINAVAIPTFYARAIGQPAATNAQLAATDGAVMLDVIELAATSGFDVGEQVPLVPSFGTAQTTKAAVASVTADLGAGYLGIRLYQRDMDMIGQGPWTAAVADSGDAVGGHCLLSWDYASLNDDGLVRLATWGILQPAAWEWLIERLDEVHGLVWPQCVPPGFDVAGLNADLAKLGT